MKSRETANVKIEFYIYVNKSLFTKLLKQYQIRNTKI